MAPAANKTSNAAKAANTNNNDATPTGNASTAPNAAANAANKGKNKPNDAPSPLLTPNANDDGLGPGGSTQNDFFLPNDATYRVEIPPPSARPTPTILTFVPDGTTENAQTTGAPVTANTTPFTYPSHFESTTRNTPMTFSVTPSGFASPNSKQLFESLVNSEVEARMAGEFSKMSLRLDTVEKENNRILDWGNRMGITMSKVTNEMRITPTPGALDVPKSTRRVSVREEEDDSSDNHQEGPSRVPMAPRKKKTPYNTRSRDRIQEPLEDDDYRRPTPRLRTMESFPEDENDFKYESVPEDVNRRLPSKRSDESQIDHHLHTIATPPLSHHSHDNANVYEDPKPPKIVRARMGMPYSRFPNEVPGTPLQRQEWRNHNQSPPFTGHIDPLQNHQEQRSEQPRNRPDLNAGSERRAWSTTPEVRESMEYAANNPLNRRPRRADVSPRAFYADPRNYTPAPVANPSYAPAPRATTAPLQSGPYPIRSSFTNQVPLSQSLAQPAPIVNNNALGDRTIVEHRLGLDDLIDAAEIETDNNSRIEVDDWTKTSALLKNVRPKAPSTYSGEETSVKALENFVHDTIEFLRASRLMRVELNGTMVSTIGSYLTGAAKEWFKHTISMSPHLVQFTPRDVYTGLRNRFIHKSDLLESADGFDNWTQGKMSVEEAFEDILSLVERMQAPHNEYHVARRFFVGLNSDILANFKNQGLVPEGKTLIEIKMKALEAQESIRYYKRTQLSRNSSSNQPTSKVITANDSSKHRFTPRTTSNHHKGGFERKSSGPQQPSSSSRPSSTNHNHDRLPSSSKQPYSNHRSSPPKPFKKSTSFTKGDSSKMDTSNITCYRCGRKGHMVSNCPNPPNRAYLIQHGETVEEATDRMQLVDDRSEGEKSDEAEREAAVMAAIEEETNDFNEDQSDDQNGDDGDYTYYGVNQESSDDGSDSHAYAIRLSSDENLHSHAVKRETEPKSEDLLFIGNVSKHDKSQPVRDRRGQRCVEALVQVNGKSAHALLDSGSNCDIISGDFVQANGLQTFDLEGAQNLQMACMGSKTKLQRGIYLDIAGSKINERRYFDVANIEGFDMILGTPFLHKNGITLHFDGRKAYATIAGSSRTLNHNVTTQSNKISLDAPKSSETSSA